MDILTRQTLDKYIDFISERAKGTSITTAMWMREFVRKHPQYKQDSIVNEQIQYDLIWKIQEMYAKENGIRTV